MARSALCQPLIDETPLTIEDIKAPAKEALEATTQTIIDELKAQVPMIETITSYLIERGGKRLRPTILLLAAQAIQSLHTGATTDLQTPILLATVVELIHSATLLHDDIVDESTLRRGQKTANANWGNAASVLAGDFLYSRAFQILARVADIPISQQLANTTNQLAEGEMMQLVEAHKAEMTVDDYWQVIHLKTATLFECACRIGAMAVHGAEEHVQAMATYGQAFGMAYQIIDDTLDYQMGAATLGKDRFNDLNEGKMTLPLILTKAQAPADLKALIDNIMQGDKPSEAEQHAIYQFMLDHNIFPQCHEYAASYAQKAQQSLQSVTSDSPAWHSLQQLSEFILHRDH
jgi:octaprenyl-diphosphate synthase